LQKAVATSAHTPTIIKQGRQGVKATCSVCLGRVGGRARVLKWLSTPCHPVGVPDGAAHPAGRVPEAHQRIQIGGRSPHQSHNVVSHEDIPHFLLQQLWIYVCTRGRSPQEPCQRVPSCH
jgi:hypothetical protein